MTRPLRGQREVFRRLEGNHEAQRERRNQIRELGGLEREEEPRREWRQFDEDFHARMREMMTLMTAEPVRTQYVPLTTMRPTRIVVQNEFTQITTNPCSEILPRVPYRSYYTNNERAVTKLRKDWNSEDKFMEEEEFKAPSWEPAFIFD